MSSDEPQLTIGAVAAATNVAVPVLRAWEARYGFPRPQRSPRGHRRYDQRDVDQIRQVLRERQAGLALDAAIGRVLGSPARDASVCAGLRRRHPGLPVLVLSRRAMLAVSRAIEDECAASAERAVLVAAFQREDRYRRSEDRWRDLAGTAAFAAVLAEFPADRATAPRELALAAEDPLRREWAVVCDAPHAAACLAGIERPGEPGRFDAVWSVDPAVVRDATDIALGIAGRGRALVRPELAPVVADADVTVRRAMSITARLIQYLDR